MPTAPDSGYGVEDFAGDVVELLNFLLPADAGEAACPTKPADSNVAPTIPNARALQGRRACIPIATNCTQIPEIGNENARHVDGETGGCGCRCAAQVGPSGVPTGATSTVK